MLNNKIEKIGIGLILIIIMLSPIYAQRIIDVFEGTDTELLLTYNQDYGNEETESTYIDFDIGECVESANISFFGEYINTEFGIPADVVLITDLSGSMGQCITDYHWITERVTDQAECEAMLDLGELTSYDEYSFPTTLYSDIELTHMWRCNGLSIQGSCYTPYCTVDCGTYSEVANCGGDGTGDYTTDACCGDPDSCCSQSCCDTGSFRSYTIENTNCDPTTVWDANSAIYCRESCMDWTSWEFGSCPADTGVEIYGCLGGGGCTSIPQASDLTNYCEQGSDDYYGLSVTEFETNCSSIVYATVPYDSSERVCNDWACNHLDYRRCYVYYGNWNEVDSCEVGEYTAEHCLTYNPGAGENEFYEYDITNLRADKREYRSCNDPRTEVRWPIVEEAVTTIWDCSSDDVYSCRSNYWDAGFDDSSWTPITIDSGDIDNGWEECDRCSVFYRTEFYMAQTEIDNFDNMTLSIASDDGAICHINDLNVHYDPTGHGTSYWNFQNILLSSDIQSNLRASPLPNILTCQAKEFTGGEGFDAELLLDEDTSSPLIPRENTWRMKKQETLCGANRDGSSNEHNPDRNSCEYNENALTCDGLYPYNNPSFRPMNVSAVIRGPSSTQQDNYDFGLEEVGRILANHLKGSYIYDFAGPTGGDNLIPSGFWDSADVLIIDKDTGGNWYRDEIRNQIFNGKIVVTTYQNYRDIRNSISPSPTEEFFNSYDTPMRYFDHGSGRLITFGTNWYYHYLGEYWRRDENIYSNCLICDKFDTAANIFNAIYPVWYSGSDSSHTCETEEYCLQGAEYNECRGCTVTKYKLAKQLDNSFVDQILFENSLGNLAQVTYGTNVGDVIDLTDYTEVDVHHTAIDAYEPFDTESTKYTCVSCSIDEALDVLDEGENSIQYMVLMSDGRANRCLGGTSCGTSTAIDQAIDLACDEDDPNSAVSKGINIFTVAFGMSPDTIPPDRDDDGANFLLWRIANCTEGLFYSGTDEEALGDIYMDIAEIVTSGFPTPKVDVNADSSIDFEIDDSLDGNARWNDSSCSTDSGVVTCNPFDDELNSGLTNCYNSATDCNIPLDIISSTPGYLRLRDLSISTVQFYTGPIVVDGNGGGGSGFTCDIINNPSTDCGDGDRDPPEETCDDGKHCEEGSECDFNSDCSTGTCIPRSGDGCNEYCQREIGTYECLFVDRTIFEDQEHLLNLNDDVFDLDDQEFTLSWIWEQIPMSNFNIINDGFNVVSLIPVLNWNGWEQINFTVTDDDGDWDKICINFTVMPVPEYTFEPVNATRLLISKGKMVSGYGENILGEIKSWGPYIITIKVWEKDIRKNE